MYMYPYTVAISCPCCILYFMLFLTLHFLLYQDPHMYTCVLTFMLTHTHTHTHTLNHTYMYMYNITHTHTHTHCDMPTLFLYQRPWTLLLSAVRGGSLGLGSVDGGRWSWIHGGWSSGLPWQKLRSLAH